MPLNEIIKGKVVSCQPNASIKDVALLMKSQDVGAVLVTENGKPVGICTDRDIVLRCVTGTMPVTERVEKIMSRDVDCVSIDHGIQDVIRLMRAREIRRIPVVDHDGKAVGLISFGDIVSLLAKELGEVSATTALGIAA